MTANRFAVQDGQHGSPTIHTLVLVKPPDRYVFLYDDASRAETLRTLGRFAANPDLSFTWYDAAVLSQKVRAGIAVPHREEGQ